MTNDSISLNYILNDGQVVSANVDFGEYPSATVILNGRKRTADKKIESKVIEIRLKGLVNFNISEDFTSRYYSDITLTKLENGDFYLSLDPYDNTNRPNEQDNFVFRCKEIEIRDCQ